MLGGGGRPKPGALPRWLESKCAPLPAVRSGHKLVLAGRLLARVREQLAAPAAQAQAELRCLHRMLCLAVAARRGGGGGDGDAGLLEHLTALAGEPAGLTAEQCACVLELVAPRHSSAVQAAACTLLVGSVRKAGCPASAAAAVFQRLLGRLQLSCQQQLEVFRCWAAVLAVGSAEGEQDREAVKTAQARGRRTPWLAVQPGACTRKRLAPGRPHSPPLLAGLCRCGWLPLPGTLAAP